MIILSVALILGFAQESSATTYYVDDDCTDPGDGSTDDPFCTIQEGIDAAGAADVVEVRAGTYTECITMKDGVDVASSVGVTPTISCTTAGTATVTFENGPITCNLDGFNITHTSNDGAGVQLDGTSGTVTTTVSNCSIYSIAQNAGIKMNGVVNCTIEDNSIDDCATSGIAVGQLGTTDNVGDGSSITIQGNTIGAASPNQNQEAGIYLKGSGSVTVTIGGTGADANTIHYNASSGVRLETITDVTIDNNTVDNNTDEGILLIDVGESGNNAIVQNNTITYNSKAGINIGGASYLTVGSNNDISYNSTSGIAFNMGSVVTDPGSPNSAPVTISGNDYIHHNTYGGIGVIDAISTTNTVTITQNDIYLNDRGAIRLQDACKLEIAENTVRNNVRGGIKTGDDSADPGGFAGTYGSADLTITQNKVYGNGQSGYGGGMDVRHADGTIYNNLVYQNHRGGIRFGDWIDEIINNTVCDNGNDNGTSANPDDDIGGGIVYDDISAGDAVNDPPEGALPNTNVLIRNNISAFNVTPGFRVGEEPSGLTSCPDNPDRNNPVLGDKYRDYNLVYANNGTGETDCNWSLPDTLVMSCAEKQYGGCGADWVSYPNLLYPNDLIADPLFANVGNDDYRLCTSEGVPDGSCSGASPAIGAGDDGNDMGAYGGQYPITW